MSCLTAKIYRNTKIKLKATISPICTSFGFLESSGGKIYLGKAKDEIATFKIFSNSKYIIDNE